MVKDSFVTAACPVVVASFNFSRSILTGTFNGTGTTGATGYSWNFGDGNSGTGNTVAHPYATAGAYIVTLIASNGCGNSDTMILSIQVCDTLTADFNYTANGDTISFDASPSTNAITYRWDFNGVAGNGQMTNYVFPNPGTKPVTLTVFNACGDSISITKNVPVCLKPKADWTYNIISTTSAGMLTQFDGSLSQNAVTYEWDFGDGSPLVTGQIMPQHLYLTPGLFYKVTLKVTNTCNEVSISSFRLNQIDLEEVNLLTSFTIYPNPASEAVTVEWDATSVKVTAIEILDASGKLVLKPELDISNIGSQNLNVGSLAEGYYMISITTNQGVVQHKLIIK